MHLLYVHWKINLKINYKYFFFIIFIFVFSCNEKSNKINYTKKFNNYSNKGFALIYDENFLKSKIVNKKINNRSLLIFNIFLEEETPVKVTNLINGKYLLAKVGKNANYPFFYNSVISKRIALDLEINLNEPYIEIKTLNQKNSFIIGKAKTFDEEKNVANKVPIKGIKIKNISSSKNEVKLIVNKSKNHNVFKYIIKIADLYFEDSAKILKNRLSKEYDINSVKIKKMSKNSYRIYIGPFNNLDSIKREYRNIIKLNFENIEIIKLWKNY